jgi:hypothetical protein
MKDIRAHQSLKTTFRSPRDAQLNYNSRQGYAYATTKVPEPSQVENIP